MPKLAKAIYSYRAFLALVVAAWAFFIQLTPSFFSRTKARSDASENHQRILALLSGARGQAIRIQKCKFYLLHSRRNPAYHFSPNCTI